MVGPTYRDAPRFVFLSTYRIEKDSYQKEKDRKNDTFERAERVMYPLPLPPSPSEWKVESGLCYLFTFHCTNYTHKVELLQHQNEKS